LEKTYFEWSTIYYRGLPDFCLLNPLGPKAAPKQRDIFLWFSRAKMPRPRSERLVILLGFARFVVPWGEEFFYLLVQ
jgi:hypothetical protein